MLKNGNDMMSRRYKFEDEYMETETWITTSENSQLCEKYFNHTKHIHISTLNLGYVYNALL